MKKQYILNLILLLIIALFGCEQSKEEIEPQIEEDINIQRINVSDDALLLKLLESTLGHSTNGRMQTTFGEIDLEEAIKIEIPETNTTRYSLLLDNESDADLAFQNYILEEVDGQVSQYIMQYELDIEWALSNGIDDMSSYTGIIKTIDIDGEVLLENELKNGQIISGANGGRTSGKSPTNGKTEYKDCYAIDIYSSCYSWGNIFQWSSQTWGFGCLGYETVIEFTPVECATSGGGGTGSTGGGSGDGGGSTPSGTGDGYNGGGGGTSGSGGTSDNNDDGDPIGVLADSDLEDKLAELWERQIDDTQLDPCIKDILDDLRSLDSGIGKFIGEMSESDFFQWKLESTNISNDSNCEATDYAYSSISGSNGSSFFDTSALSKASDIGIASILLHEGIHAYLQLLYQNDEIDKTYRKLFNRWTDSNEDYWAEHNNIYQDFFLILANTLQEYGQLQGFSLDYSVYEALAWGGLTSISEDGCSLSPAPWFINSVPSPTDRQEILDTIETELTGKDTNGNVKPQNGNDAGC